MNGHFYHRGIIPTPIPIQIQILRSSVHSFIQDVLFSTHGSFARLEVKSIWRSDFTSASGNIYFMYMDFTDSLSPKILFLLHTCVSRHIHRIHTGVE